MKNKIYDCVIIGAGPSGIGTGVALSELGIKDYLILDKGSIGQSFLDWTRETRFISPSFTTNMFFIPDLNAVSPLTSPAFAFNKEHLSGEEYSAYLKIVADYYNLNIKENVEIIDIRKEKDFFILTDKKDLQIFTKHLIWAGGEWSYPKKLFSNTLHTTSIKSYSDLKEDEYLIIGSGESGTDFAYNLIALGKKVTMIAENDQDKDNKNDDPSKKLSPVTIAKFETLLKNKNFKLIKNTRVREVIVEVNEVEKKYKIVFENGKSIISQNKPYEATGFQRVPELIKEFVKIKDGDLEISNFDESKKTKNLFFVGPNLHRQNVILCFIYKFRMRFAPVACEIGKRLGVDRLKLEKVKKHYKKYNMYLEDIHSCDISCEC